MDGYADIRRVSPPARRTGRRGAIQLGGQQDAILFHEQTGIQLPFALLQLGQVQTMAVLTDVMPNIQLAGATVLPAPHPH